MGFWRRKEKIKWSEEVTNEQVFEHIGEKRTISYIEKPIGLIRF